MTQRRDPTLPSHPESGTCSLRPHRLAQLDRDDMRTRFWNGTFWASLIAFEALGWFLSHQS